ncbi:MAG: transporter [Deltaproteobacteria bacterium]|nr:transporter [Deltaproteobacteria bacterium]
MAIIVAFLTFWVFFFPKADVASGSAHFSTGGSGYKLATMPPPGLYYLMYNAYFDADDYIDDRGHKIKGKDTHTTVFSQTHRLVWSTPVKILSGNLLLDIVIPVYSFDLGRTLVGPNGDTHHFGVGDPYSHVTIAWHGPTYDALASLAFFFPIGEYRQGEAASPGKGYFGLQPTFGLTWYFDKARTWTWSTIVRYEFSYKQRHTGLREGDNFHYETSVGKQLGNIALAVSSAGSFQTTNAKGKGSDEANAALTRTFSLGPEVVVGLGRLGNLSFRCLFGLEARNSSKGVTSVLTWTVPIFMYDQN